MSSGKCAGCGDHVVLDFDFTMAFQPIVDIAAGKVWGYEALVRGTNGESAFHVLNKVDEANRYKFDQACRVRAIELAGRLFPRNDATKLSINFMPNAVYEPAACIRASLMAAKRAQFNPTRLMFEFTENEHLTDTAHIKKIVEEYQRLGFVTALDDFGAGYAGLNLLARFQPDLLKIDMDLIRGIEASHAKRVIVAAIVHVARELDIKVLAEGVETEGELWTLREIGIHLFQGYLFAKPMVEQLPTIEFRLAA